MVASRSFAPPILFSTPAWRRHFSRLFSYPASRCDLLYLVGMLVRTPATKAYFQEYRKKLPSNFNAVQNGGWYALEQKSTAELAAANFAKWKPNLPSKLDVVRAGGWSTVEALAADPKGVLLNVVRAQLKGTTRTGVMPEQMDAVVALLRAQGKGFDSTLVNGEWALAWQRQGKKSAIFQKLVGRREKVGKSYSNFDVSKLEFYGKVILLKWGILSSVVKYRPVAEAFDKQKSIILRRIRCDIMGAGWKFGFLPKLPIPLKRSGGFLDFQYLDEDIRVTSGNRGGLFVHARQECLDGLLD